jgi:hypothetical protein
MLKLVKGIYKLFKKISENKKRNLKNRNNLVNRNMYCIVCCRTVFKK